MAPDPAPESGRLRETRRPHLDTHEGPSQGSGCAARCHRAWHRVPGNLATIQYRTIARRFQVPRVTKRKLLPHVVLGEPGPLSCLVAHVFHAWKVRATRHKLLQIIFFIDLKFFAKASIFAF